MSKYTPGQKVTITLDPEVAETSSFLSAPGAVFGATYQRSFYTTDDSHKVTYVNKYGRLVERTVFGEELSAA